jgi:hypothetical protein
LLEILDTASGGGDPKEEDLSKPKSNEPPKRKAEEGSGGDAEEDLSKPKKKRVRARLC